MRSVIVAGECVYDARRRPFLAKINLAKEKVELIKILNMEDKITATAFGPYDNGYLIVGFESGCVHIFDPCDLIRLSQLAMSESPISKIAFEPTNMIFVSDLDGNVVAFSMEKKEKHYVYLDLGKKQYCTIALPHARTRNDNGFEYEDKGAFCCI